MVAGMAETAPTPRPLLPAAPTLVAGARAALWLGADGEIETLGHAEAAARAAQTPPMVAHAPATWRRLGCDPVPAYDVLELFAFVRPARFVLPTPRGLAAMVGLDPPRDMADEAAALPAVAGRLLAELMAARDPHAPGVASALGQAGWAWGPAVCAALDVETGPGRLGGLAVWRRLGRWAEHAPEPPPGNVPVEPGEARRRLAELLDTDAEARPQQADYASAVSAAFTPRPAVGEPTVVLAEAGTGTGKTLGYVAPASLWAEKNDGPVWVSTFTRNLQRQLDAELDRLFPDPELKAARVAVRKGRENYLCLLNMEDAVGRFLALRPHEAVGLGLMARWALATRDGDLGGDFPAWLVDLVGPTATLGLADRRGECIYSACAHYDKCFIEHSVRRARRARIVVANHALVMIQAALGNDDGAPTRYVFDEGHHLFDAADSAFAGHLSAREAADLRRWLLGAEAGRRGRGLRDRAGDLLGDDDAAVGGYRQVLEAARALPGPGWTRRLGDGQPSGPTEAFLTLVRAQVYARAHAPDSPYGLETEMWPLDDGLEAAAVTLGQALARLAKPMQVLRECLLARLDDEADELDTPTRQRIEAVARGLNRRALQVTGWLGMLDRVAGAEADDAFVDWFAVERQAGRDVDFGMYRHWVDPTLPSAEAVLIPSHGAVVTSATLRDGTGDEAADWAAAAARTGADHLGAPAVRAQVPSPFDYADLTRVLIVNDVRKDDLAQVAAAYRELFKAAGGGALGLFTAIARLRGVHGRIAAELEAFGLPLLAQHVDGMDVGTLIDIFRAETDTCLLGTDAVRDGVDVPGRALRLIVFDRVPWPRPTILHRARRQAFGGRAYDDMIARLRLKQAFGRLVRRADDRGVFVLLDPMMPSRLLGAFPAGVEPQRIGLADAIAQVRAHVGA